MWLDKRATWQSGRILDLTGESIDPSFYLAKILWLKDNEREAMKRPIILSPGGVHQFIMTRRCLDGLSRGRDFGKGIVDRKDLIRRRLGLWTRDNFPPLI